MLLFVDMFRAYFKQAREELAIRLCDRLFDADGTKNKWWQVTSTNRFNMFPMLTFDAIFSMFIVFFEEEIHGQGVERLI